MMTLAELEREIQTVYLFFAEKAPGVTPAEDGRLGELWKIADMMYAEEGE